MHLKPTSGGSSSELTNQTIKFLSSNAQCRSFISEATLKDLPPTLDLQGHASPLLHTCCMIKIYHLSGTTCASFAPPSFSSSVGSYMQRGWCQPCSPRFQREVQRSRRVILLIGDALGHKTGIERLLLLELPMQ